MSADYAGLDLRTVGAEPARRLAANPTDRAGRPETSGREPEKDRIPRILVVDDDPLILKLMRAILESAGFEVATENNGLRAVRRVQEQAFDVVFTDLVMPVSGVVAVKEILDASPDTEVILLTGYPDCERAREALAYGARLCLGKPATPQTILGTVYQVIAEQGAARRV